MLKIQTKQVIADVEAAAAAERAIAEFRASRALAVEAATVTVKGNKYDANERAIQRMTAAVLSGADESADHALSWSMADTPPGEMTAITLGELRQALRAATEQLAVLWGR